VPVASTAAVVRQNAQARRSRSASARQLHGWNEGIQRGPVVILKPIRSRFPAAPRAASRAEGERREEARGRQAAIAEINANKAAFKGAWVLIPGRAAASPGTPARHEAPDGSPSISTPI